jgi:hypothetical protein
MERFLKEVGQMLEQKMAQGAAELSQFLHADNRGYVPYGMGQAPLEVEGPATSYSDMLREASQRATPDHGHEIER